MNYVNLLDCSKHLELERPALLNHRYLLSSASASFTFHNSKVQEFFKNIYLYLYAL